MPLVPAKLTPPQVLASWIARERLLRVFEAAQARVTLVVAPAGFGKSTAVAQWLLSPQGRRGGAPASPAHAGAAPRARPAAASVVWLTLDEHDQDAQRFLTYLGGAIARVAPQALATARPLLEAPETSPPFVILQALLVDLSTLAGGLTLVLDDYHTLGGQEVHRLVVYLLRHLPPQVRLVLISRVDPPLPLARLRADRQLAEVRVADLRFTEAETSALLANLGGAALDEAEVAALQQQTEGWAIALQLAALAHLQGGAPELARSATARQVAEYLGDEVLVRQSDELSAALLALAVPERFCAELCAALLGTPEEIIHAESLLEQLLRANLFLIPLDDEGCWYRFHHMFRDLLLRRLRLTAGQEGTRRLQRRAAAWLDASGLTEEAVRLYLAAGDEDAAAALVERLLFPEMARDTVGTPPGYWLQMLPLTLVARRPGLALAMLRLSVFSMDMADFQASLERLEALLADPATAPATPPWPTFMADLTVLRGILFYWQGRTAETIGAMGSALKQGPTLALATQALLLLGRAYVGEGAYAEGVQLIAEGLPEVSERLGNLHELYRHTCLANMHHVAAELGAQEREARRVSELVAAGVGGDYGVGHSASSLGLVAYERSELDVAVEHFASLTARKDKVSYPGYMEGLIGQALIACARGAYDQADNVVQEAFAFAGEVRGEFLRHQALGCAVRVALARGDVDVALRLAADIGRDMHLGLSLSLETPRLSQVRALIAAGDLPHLAQAERLLAGCLSEVEALHNARLLIVTLAIRALLRDAQGRPADARADLEQAVALAAPRGLMRSFIDLGPPLLPLLRALAPGVAPAFTECVIAAMRPPGARELPPPAAIRLVLPEFLTPRETEILGLLAERWSDKEIAEQLVIAPNTVRKHTSTIYDKLGVAGRREAVDVARALGLLPVI